MIDEDSIALIDTEALVRELKARFPDGCIVAVEHPPHEVKSSNCDWRIYFGGKKLTTLKLANLSVWMHNQAFMGNNF